MKLIVNGAHWLSLRELNVLLAVPVLELGKEPSPHRGRDIGRGLHGVVLRRLSHCLSYCIEDAYLYKAVSRMHYLLFIVLKIDSLSS